MAGSADELAEMTGLSREVAQRLLDSHGGDANAAASTFFASGQDASSFGRAEGTPAPATPAGPSAPASNPAAREGSGASSSDLVEGILDGAASMDDAASAAATNRGSFGGQGHRLTSSPPKGAGSDAATGAPAAVRDITVVFYRDGFTMHERLSGAASRRPTERRTGMHTFDPSAGSHPHPDLSEGGYEEIARVPAGTPDYERHLRDLKQSRVPRLPALASPRAGTHYNLALRDSRKVAMPGAPTDEAKGAGASYAGTGHVLGGGGGGGGASAAGPATPGASRPAGTGGLTALEWRGALAGAVAAAAVPLAYWAAGLGSPTLGHALLGGVLGLGSAAALQRLRDHAAAASVPQFSVDPSLPTATVRVRLAGVGEQPTARTETIAFNPSLHTVGDLYRQVNARMPAAGPNPASWTLLGGYPPRPLAREDERTLQEAGLGNTQVVQRM